MVVSNRNLLFQGSIFRGYVSFREGTQFPGINSFVSKPVVIYPHKPSFDGLYSLINHMTQWTNFRSSSYPQQTFKAARCWWVLQMAMAKNWHAGRNLGVSSYRTFVLSSIPSRCSGVPQSVCLPVPYTASCFQVWFQHFWGPSYGVFPPFFCLEFMAAIWIVWILMAFFQCFNAKGYIFTVDSWWSKLLLERRWSLPRNLALESWFKAEDHRSVADFFSRFFGWNIVKISEK